MNQTPPTEKSPTEKSTKQKTLFEPVRVGALQLKSRLVMNPMTRSRADAEGVVGELTAKYYAQRAGAGLIVTEGIAPSANGKGYARIPGLWTQAQVDAWKVVTAGVHAAGGVIFAQLMHTGRVSHPANMVAGGKVVAPSAIALEGTMWTDSQQMQPYPVPNVLDDAGIDQAKNEFVLASKNAIAAGFDGVELHGANGYLIEQFISPHTNRRTDRWGGSIESRLRFPIEVTRAVVAAIGADKVAIRLSPHGLASGMVDYPEVDETYLALAKALAPLGLAYVHIADHAGPKGNPKLDALKASLRKVWPGVLLVGGSFEHASAERAVSEGVADLAGFGKAYLANPDLAHRFQKGLPLNAPDPSTFFTPGPKGYIDYPTAE
jgi:N-ethylmaleimide reductase